VSIIELDFIDFLKMAGSSLVVLIGAAWVLIKIIVNQFTTHLDKREEANEKLRVIRDNAMTEKFARLEESIKHEGDGWRQVERELLKLKADLPLHYVRKEDAIRQEVVIHAKLDALADKIDALKMGV
jgi:flagellar biosynthesis/type III secretory pathway M-ring protein FliF/YscJ